MNMCYTNDDFKEMVIQTAFNKRKETLLHRKEILKYVTTLLKVRFNLHHIECMNEREKVTILSQNQV